MSSLRVGLTGGIGAGKSEVSRRLESYGAVVIDADLIARQVVAPGTPGLAQVVAAFGEGVLGPDGSLDRDRLGELVFADASLRGKLNAIVHPLVGARMRELEEAADEAAIVVHDIPLLAENHLADSFDEVVVVDSAPRVQADRLAKERGMTPEQAEARMRAQATREERLAIATIVVDNSGSLAELDRETGELWAELRRRAKRLAGGRTAPLRADRQLLSDPRLTVEPARREHPRPGRRSRGGATGSPAFGWLRQGPQC